MTDGTIEVDLVQAWPDHCLTLRVQAPAGATVAEALRLAAATGFAPAADADPGCLAIFGNAVSTATRLHAGDRIELLRPLLVDPKQRRRERAGGGRP